MIKYLIIGFLLSFSLACQSPNQEFRKITLEDYRSRMMAGWLGQMAGVGWGAPTEFKYNSSTIPENQLPEWEQSMINQHFQDDIYVEMTFLRTLEKYGFDVSNRQVGIDFANTKYQLWHANRSGRENLRLGIVPPYSGHPNFNVHFDDIDYQIEADFSGLIAPGMPKMVYDLGQKFGRIMNYGDGLNGGIFIGSMYAAAFFESDIHKIIQNGLLNIPPKSQYAEAINDVIKWHEKFPDDWKKAWQLIESKYNLNKKYRKFSCNGNDENFNIDAKINGAYVVLGLLYGNGDMDQTITISILCGKDSDCNPSNAAGILATSKGINHLPKKYISGIDQTTKFAFSSYDFPSLLSVCESLARIAVVKMGGKIKKNTKGEEEWLIPMSNHVITNLDERLDTPILDENVDIRFSSEELRKITQKTRKPFEHITNWYVAGPFSNDSIGEGSIQKKTNILELDSIDFCWSKMPIDWQNISYDGIDLLSKFEVFNSYAYLRTGIWMPRDRVVIFEVGSDGKTKLWLNNNLVYQNNLSRVHVQGQDVLKVELAKGWNKVLMQVGQGTLDWGVSLVITDTLQNAIKIDKFKEIVTHHCD